MKVKAQQSLGNLISLSEDKKGSEGKRHSFRFFFNEVQNKGTMYNEAYACVPKLQIMMQYKRV